MNKNLSTVILLNGPSSSGKSTLAQALQEKLETPFLHIGIDKIIEMMPWHLNNWEGGKSEMGFWWKESRDQENHKIYEIQMGPYAKKIRDVYKEVVKTLANNALNIIVDEVAFGNVEMQVWREKLKDFNTYYIGINSELHTLEEREKVRGDRILGSARHQFYTVHEDIQYDLIINTDKESLEDSIDKIIKLIK